MPFWNLIIATREEGCKMASVTATDGLVEGADRGDLNGHLANGGPGDTDPMKSSVL